MAERADDVTSLLVDGARALECDGDVLAGRRRFEAAYREAERTGDVRAMAEAVLGTGGLWVHEHRTVAGAMLLAIRRALDQIAKADPVIGEHLACAVHTGTRCCYRPV